MLLQARPTGLISAILDVGAGLRLDHLTSVHALIAALLAGSAVGLLMKAPRSRWPTPPEVGGERWRTALPRPALLIARPDAASLPYRVAVASAAALGIGLGLRSEGQVWGLLSWLVMPVAALVGVVVLGRLEPGRSRQRRQRLILDLPHALELLSASLAAGLPLRLATAAVADACDGPVAEDLGQVLTRVELGVGDADAWLTLRDHPQWGTAAVDLARSVESGTMMVEVLVHHAREARGRRRASMEVAAKAVGVRSVLPLMTCFLPAFLLVGVIPTVASALINALSWT